MKDFPCICFEFTWKQSHFQGLTECFWQFTSITWDLTVGYIFADYKFRYSKFRDIKFRELSLLPNQCVLNKIFCDHKFVNDTKICKI